jgi:hypothetical protein
MRKIALFLVLGWISTCLAVRAEEIQLKDGNKVTGKIIAVNEDAFQIKTPYGNIMVPRSDIISISFPENQPGKEGASADEPALPKIDETLQGTSYTNRTAKFQVTVPAGWMISDALRKQSKDIVAALESPDKTLFFMATPEKFAGTLATYQVLAETQYQAKFMDYEKTAESSVHIDGRDGTRLIWRGKNTQANNAALQAVIYIIPYEGRMVRLSFLTLEPLFNDALPIFDKIAASFHSTP